MIPPDFPPPPQPPGAQVPFSDVAWYNYFVDQQAWLAKLAAALKG